jgi:alanyl-tRNA synthetase
MTSAEVRQSFLDFFREKQHTVVPSSSLLPHAPNLLFTNAGMNQFVPIFLGQQKAPWNPPRVADTQKCIRAGGKHNDLEDVGLDTYHHTFFEMLGNWSFGDYFKKEAIEWAWELVVDRWKFPAQRLYATVYKPGPDEPADFDQEAHDHWARLFRDVDLDPKVHVVNGGKADNFWMMGDTGPCGPCSELHVDLTPDGDTRGSLVNKGDPRCIEIWNLVFIQFNADGDGKFTPLPQRHVDTGMGFERVSAIIQGTKNLTDFSGTISNYETDVFRPIFDELEKLSGKKYASTLPIVEQAHRLPDEDTGSRSGRPTIDHEQPQIDIAFRVIADHIRTLSFAIADGISPSNEGRGYVLRRILRRAVRYGRSLGFHEPFFFKLVDVVAKTMGDVFPELRQRKEKIEAILRAEEENFSRTLDRGIKLFENQGLFLAVLDQVTRENRHHFKEPTSLAEAEEDIDFTGDEPSSIEKIKFFVLNRTIKLTMKELADGAWKSFLVSPPRISGEFAFELYDTYGFPLDLTELMARERGLTVDIAGFEKLMEQQRERARKAQKKSLIEVLDQYDAPTEFVGYDSFESDAELLGTIGDPKGRQYAVLDKSPFYAEMGGQVGDTGQIRLKDGRILNVTSTTKRGATYYHQLKEAGPIFTHVPSEPARAFVDIDRRKLIQGHHTVTHLLHWALHEIVSRDASQKGSYVGPDKLTFDFSSAPLTKQQVRDVEKLVNEKIAGNTSVSWTEIPYAQAKQRKDIAQFFGEKYGDTVRVLQIGGEPRALNGYSMELCGGTHVRSTGEIGPFRIVKEEAIAAGVRRIEAVAGDAARKWAEQEATRQREKFEVLARKKPDLASLPKFDANASTSDMLQQIDARAVHFESAEADVREWEKKTAKAAEGELQSRAAHLANELAAAHKDSCIEEIKDADSKLLVAIVDALKSKIAGPIFLAGARDTSVALVAYVPPSLTAKFQANKLIQEIAPMIGGKGGGRPELAQGAGKDPSKIKLILARATEILSD